MTPAQSDDLRKATEALAGLIPEAAEMLGQLGTYLEELGQLKGIGQVLQDRVDSLRRQMDDMYKTVALGLTAEALSHEIFQIADNLALRTKTVESRLLRQGSRRHRICGDSAFIGDGSQEAGILFVPRIALCPRTTPEH